MKNYKFIFIACLFIGLSSVLSASVDVDFDRFCIEAYLEDAKVLEPDLQNDWSALLILKSKNGDLEIPIRREWKHQNQAEQDIERLKIGFSNKILKVCLEDVFENDNFQYPDYISADEPCCHVFYVLVFNPEGTSIDGYADKLAFTHSFNIESYPQILSYEKVYENISEGWFWNTYYVSYLIELNDGTIWKTEESHSWKEEDKESFRDNVASQLCIGDHVMLLGFRDDIFMISLGNKECSKKEILADIFDESYNLVKVTHGTINRQCH